MEIDYVRESSKTVNDLIFEDKLKEKKYGILTRVNVKEVMEEKGIPFEREIVILGICNPHHAKKAILADERVAIFLPCTAVVYETDNGSRIRLAKPSMITGFFQNDELKELGKVVEEDLIQVIDISI
ncbi:MAG: DUF302 domain-containing protein [Actinomycetia bacterium]|nr:DUF302 domain-containing protein [Actinomycetes bacterium]